MASFPAEPRLAAELTIPRDPAAAAPGGVRLPVDPGKLLKMTWPLYALIALGMALNPAEWLRPSLPVFFALGAPLLLPLLGILARGRWALELTPDALVHHTLVGPERYAWTRMGVVELRLVHVVHLPLARTLWFPFPTDAPQTLRERTTAVIGRRLLAVFGDRPAHETAERLESWRRLALAREGL